MSATVSLWCRLGKNSCSWQKTPTAFTYSENGINKKKQIMKEIQTKTVLKILQELFWLTKGSIDLSLHKLYIPNVVNFYVNIKYNSLFKKWVMQEESVVHS